MKRSTMQDYIDQRESERKQIYFAKIGDETHFTLNGHPYELVKNYRDGFDADQFAIHFSAILSKYDYIVGDWGFDALRLRGFYAKGNPDYSVDRDVKTIEDYLFEDCNFGCPYFVVHNIDVKPAPVEKRSFRRHHRRGYRGHNHGHRNVPYSERKTSSHERSVRHRHNTHAHTVNGHSKHRKFVIHERHDRKERSHD